MLFTDEVLNMQELIAKLSTLTELNHVKVAVICFLYDKDGKLILNRRGPGARDEIGKLQAIGGSVNGHDANFREAMLRELREEAGEVANIRLGDFIAAQVDSKVDNTTNQMTDWIILAYKGYLESGTLINNEPDRCIGFEKDEMANFLDKEISRTVYNFIKYMIEGE